MLIGIFLIVVSCSDSKITKLATQGSVSKEQFNEVIPFNYLKNHIYIDVIINEKAYTFLFDTGCDITSIDKSILSELNFSPEISQKVTGSSFDEIEFQYGTMSNSLRIGNLDFQNIGVGVQDLSFLKPLEENFTDGTKIYGIIGTNIIKKAFWQIDYTEKSIKFSNSINNLISDFDTIIKINTIPKETENWGTNEINVTVNGVSENFILDTGSFGRFSANVQFLEKLQKNTNNTLKEIGTNEKSEKRKFKTEKIEVGSIKLQNQELLIQDGIGLLIGNGFLENYITTIDLLNNKLYLKPNK